LAFRSTTPQEGREHALLDLPEGEGAPGFALNPKYTQSSVLRNTETASTHQSVSYLNAFPWCDPPMHFLFGLMRFLNQNRE
jgi:hypothetical protein